MELGWPFEFVAAYDFAIWVVQSMDLEDNFPFMVQDYIFSWNLCSLSLLFRKLLRIHASFSPAQKCLWKKVNLETSKSGYLTDWCMVCLSMQQMKASPSICDADFSPFGI